MLPPAAIRLHWNKHRREFTLEGMIVKRFRRLSSAQIVILETFESLDWPESVANPLGGKAKKLHNAVFKLNRHQGPAIIRFESNGTGRIIWTVLNDGRGQAESGKSDGG